MIAVHPQFWWWVSRATGMVATILLVVSLVWGVLLATRALRQIDRPAWLLATHRWFSALACIGIALHVAGLVADNYVHFGWREILVPWGSSWKNTPVALGVIAFYLIAAVQVTSLLMKRLPKRFWRLVHMTSYVAVWLGVVHGALAGTDATNRIYQLVALLLSVAAAVAAGARVIVGSTRAQRAQRAQPAAPRAPRSGVVHPDSV